MDYLRVGCASLIGLVFLASAVSKLRDYGGFTRSLPALAPVRPGLLQPLAVVVIASEAAVPILLAIPPAMTFGFGLSCCLLCAFSAAIAVALKRGQHAPCRCFGSSSRPLGAGHLIRNAILLITAVAGGLAGGLAPGVHAQLAGVAVAIPAGLFGAILIVAFDDIAYLFARSF
jgi:hypothetical protein